MKCEFCGKELDWKKNKNMFQSGVSKRFYYFRGKHKIMNLAAYCSKRCEKQAKKLR